MAASPFCSYLELGGSVPPPVSLKTRAPIVVHGRVPVEQRGGEGVGWTRTRAAAGIIGLQQRSLTRPWTDGQTWSPKASIPRKPRYNSLSSSSSSSISLSRSAWQSRTCSLAGSTADGTEWKYGESRVIRSYFPRNADCLPAFQPLCIRFFFFFFICPSVTTFLEQGNWYVVFFYFLFTRCNDHLFARDEDYRLSIIFDKIRWYSDLEGLKGKRR